MRAAQATHDTAESSGDTKTKIKTAARDLMRAVPWSDDYDC